ncbi:hypothetical protein CBR_g29305 [Chara braunii]|uniref:Uncharacterized protein n=1 Tax=Chara braunii TaxID=69332 RepID=A0A388LAE3_CHABU|nr:hypothetical protein CBR_g29305 [Chara braunii]|eukprot:GBG79254.1 hypothetical protein CBR_g29305 [Chara braunii]
MAGAATALRADVWQTADSLCLPGIERGSETAVQRWTRVQQCAPCCGLRGVERGSRPSFPIATNAVFNCRSQELPASHSFHRRSGLEDVSHHDLVKKGGVLAGSEKASVWRRRVIVGGSGGHEGNAENRLSFGGETKCSLRAVSPWLMAAERERRGFVLRATRAPSPNVQDEEDKKKKKKEEEEEKEPFVRPKLPGDEPDFWEGEQWDWLGFVLQYLWAVGIVVAVL